MESRLASEGFGVGAVVAPAGCGKTQIICTWLSEHTGEKPILILTHTHAGVAALRTRLRRAGISSSSFVLSTIDGWALRTVAMFPKTCSVEKATLSIQKPSRDYPNLRSAAAELVQNKFFQELLCSSFSAIIVDEYQDCTKKQHFFISCMSNVLPTAILGDPMQAVFGFGPDQLPSWEKEVLETFPKRFQLEKPWRWVNAQEKEFGEWLLSVRAELYNGKTIDLRDSPRNVEWVQLHGTDDHAKRLSAARSKGPTSKSSVVVIGESTSPDKQRRYASGTPGAVCVESVHLGDFVDFFDRLDLSSAGVTSQLVEFTDRIVANLGAKQLLERSESIKAERNRREASELEMALVRFDSERTYEAMAEFLSVCSATGGVRVHRPTILSASLKTIRRFREGSRKTVGDIAREVREEFRLAGRDLPNRAVGSTLLLKGLEADVSVILNADEMNAKHLYVAMTRGSRKLVICSSSPVLPRQ